MGLEAWLGPFLSAIFPGTHPLAYTQMAGKLSGMGPGPARPGAPPGEGAQQGFGRTLRGSAGDPPPFTVGGGEGRRGGRKVHSSFSHRVVGSRSCWTWGTQSSAGGPEASERFGLPAENSASSVCPHAQAAAWRASACWRPLRSLG